MWRSPINGVNVQGLCVTLCIQVCVRVCGGQRTTSGLFFSCSLFCIFETGSFTELEASSLGSAGWSFSSRNLPSSSFCALLYWDYRKKPPPQLFYMCSRDRSMLMFLRQALYWLSHVSNPSVFFISKPTNRWACRLSLNWWLSLLMILSCWQIGVT